MLTTLLVPLSRSALVRLQLIVSPDTVLRWHRDLIKRRRPRASSKGSRGCPRTVSSVRRLVLRLAAENPAWVGYRRIHGSGATVIVEASYDFVDFVDQCG